MKLLPSELSSVEKVFQRCILASALCVISSVYVVPVLLELWQRGRIRMRDPCGRAGCRLELFTRCSSGFASNTSLNCCRLQPRQPLAMR